MPEGHTIHRIAIDHQKLFAGQKLIVESPQGRFAGEAEEMSGRQLLGTDAYGKHLFYLWSGNRIIHIHLGLYGKFRLFGNPPPEPRGAVRLRMIGNSSSFDLNGPNCCELIDKNGHKEICARLGPDPLRDDANPEEVWAKIRNSRKSIGSLLLDQSVIAGIGNVYRAEILFLLRINPERPGCDLERSEFDQLWNLTTHLLQLGVEQKRIVTTTVDWESLNQSQRNSRRTNIYKSEFCPVCGDYVWYWPSANRTIYACESCQQ